MAKTGLVDLVVVSAIMKAHRVPQAAVEIEHAPDGSVAAWITSGGTRYLMGVSTGDMAALATMACKGTLEDRLPMAVAADRLFQRIMAVRGQGVAK